MTYAEQMLRMLSTDMLRSIVAEERRRIEPDLETIADFESEIDRRQTPRAVD